MTDLDLSGPKGIGRLPAWVPSAAFYYLAHTEEGLPIRALARHAGCHASTILRQIRKIEMRRDDPLVDAALRRLGAGKGACPTPQQEKQPGGTRSMQKLPVIQMPDEEALARDAMRVLRRLCESGAILAVADGLDKAVVVRDLPGGETARTATVDACVAQAMALKDWIAPANSGRIVRYHITGAGRTALGGFLERFGVPQDLVADGTAPPATDRETFADQEALTADRRPRYGLGESPLSALARRRGLDGKPFLSDALVNAGERLREDFELAQMDANTVHDWESYLAKAPNTDLEPASLEGTRPEAASARVQAALDNLGPGLSDVALRCCCFLEGLETTEKRLGWSARSGKVVLRIALIRLKRFYDESLGVAGAMIG